MTYTKSIYTAIITTLIFLIEINTTQANPQPNTLVFIDRVYDIYLNIPDGEQDAPIEALLTEIISYRNERPEDVSAWIASALAHIIYGGDRTNFLAQRKYFKLARSELEKAIAIDEKSQGGLASVYLGKIYGFLPPTPFSYGSKKKAEKLLKHALVIDPRSKINNAFYGGFLVEAGRHKEAKKYLDLAIRLPVLNQESTNLNQFLDDSIEDNYKSIEDLDL